MNPEDFGYLSDLDLVMLRHALIQDRDDPRERPHAQAAALDRLVDIDAELKRRHTQRLERK